MRSMLVVVLLCAAGPAAAQSRVYTNADLVQGQIHWMRTPTEQELRGLEARQFRLPLPDPGPAATVVPYDSTWPFTNSVRLEPREIDPWTMPEA